MTKRSLSFGSISNVFRTIAIELLRGLVAVIIWIIFIITFMTYVMSARPKSHFTFGNKKNTLIKTDNDFY